MGSDDVGQEAFREVYNTWRELFISIPIHLNGTMFWKYIEITLLMDTQFWTTHKKTYTPKPFASNFTELWH